MTFFPRVPTAVANSLSDIVSSQLLSVSFHIPYAVLAVNNASQNHTLQQLISAISDVDAVTSESGTIAQSLGPPPRRGR